MEHDGKLGTFRHRSSVLANVVVPPGWSAGPWSHRPGLLSIQVAPAHASTERSLRGAAVGADAHCPGAARYPVARVSERLDATACRHRQLAGGFPDQAAVEPHPQTD